MAKNRNRNRRPRKLSGEAHEVAVRATPTRAFLATIHGEKRDGVIVGGNGIQWKVG